MLYVLSVKEKEYIVYIDNGIRNHREQLSLNEIDMEDDYRKALIGFHSFTGNDYVSKFFGKGKSVCWKMMIKSDEFVSVFVSLGQDWYLSDEIKNALENYICKLYGSKKSDINEARFDIFIQKHGSKNKIIDLSILPHVSQRFIYISTLLLKRGKVQVAVSFALLTLQTMVRTNMQKLIGLMSRFHLKLQSY